MSVPTPYVFMKRFLKAAQSDRKVTINFNNYFTIFLLRITMFGRNFFTFCLLHLAVGASFLLHHRAFLGWVQDAQIPPFVAGCCSNIHCTMCSQGAQGMDKNLRTTHCLFREPATVRVAFCDYCFLRFRILYRTPKISLDHSECSMLMVDFHLKAGTGKLTGVHRKYSSFKYGCAAKTEAAIFLLEN